MGIWSREIDCSGSWSEVVAPFLGLFDQPGERADGRVGQGVGDGLGLGGLDLEVARSLMAKTKPSHPVGPAV